MSWDALPWGRGKASGYGRIYTVLQKSFWFITCTCSIHEFSQAEGSTRRQMKTSRAERKNQSGLTPKSWKNRIHVSKLFEGLLSPSCRKANRSSWISSLTCKPHSDTSVTHGRGQRPLSVPQASHAVCWLFEWNSKSKMKEEKRTFVGDVHASALGYRLSEGRIKTSRGEEGRVMV